MARIAASFSYSALVACLALIQASYASDAVYLAYVLDPARFFGVFLWYYLSLATSRILSGYPVDLLGGGALLRTSLTMQIAAQRVYRLFRRLHPAFTRPFLRGFTTSAMIVGCRKALPMYASGSYTATQS